MRIYLTATLFFLSLITYSQNRVFKTVKIAQWTLEKFPVAYLRTAAKVYTEKDKYTGKIRYYEERNSLGTVEGLRVVMQRNLIYPSMIEYTVKGIIVYRAEFFGSSNVAFAIRNINLEGILDGPQLKREKNEDLNKYDVNIVTYKNGVSDEPIPLTNDDIVRKNREFNFNKDSLLDGYFYTPYETENLWAHISGIAENGIIKKYTNQIQEISKYDSTVFIGDSVTVIRIWADSHSIADTFYHNKSAKIRIITNAVSLKNNPKYYYFDKTKFPPFKFQVLLEDMVYTTKWEYNRDGVY